MMVMGVRVMNLVALGPGKDHKDRRGQTEAMGGF